SGLLGHRPLGLLADGRNCPDLAAGQPCGLLPDVAATPARDGSAAASPSQAGPMVFALEALLAGALVCRRVQAEFRPASGGRPVGVGRYPDRRLHIVFAEPVQGSVLSGDVAGVADYARPL